jgi:hypothetical protein
MLGNSRVDAKNRNSKYPNELQYDRSGAYSYVAFKNQGEDSRSTLDISKMKFENKYKQFLTLYGQYSNAPLRQLPTNDLLTYPITQKTDVFKSYPNLTPRYR